MSKTLDAFGYIPGQSITIDKIVHGPHRDIRVITQPGVVDDQSGEYNKEDDGNNRFIWHSLSAPFSQENNKMAIKAKG
jgi:hypothetical protein